MQLTSVENVLRIAVVALSSSCGVSLFSCTAANDVLSFLCCCASIIFNSCLKSKQERKAVRGACMKPITSKYFGYGYYNEQTIEACCQESIFCFPDIISMPSLALTVIL